MTSALSAYLGHPGVSGCFEAAALVAAMLEVESALVAAQADCGLVSAEHAAAVQACCREPDWDAQALVAQAAVSGSLAIPLVKSLQARVARVNPQAVAAVHFGATSQDIIDTAVALQARKALALIQADLRRLLRALKVLDDRDGGQWVMARTLMQPALPIPLRVRLLNWAMPLARSAQRLREQGHCSLSLQLGAAVGTGTPWGQQAQALAHGMAQRLGLRAPALPWHAQRDEMARLASELGILVGAVGKVATDVALLSQGEVDELREAQAPGRGGSSAMAHKRNPVGAMVALAALHRAPARVGSMIGAVAVQQERGLGGWQAEGAELAELLDLAGAAVKAMADALDGAQFQPERMALNRGAMSPEPTDLGPRWHAAQEAAWHEIMREANADTSAPPVP